MNTNGHRQTISEIIDDHPRIQKALAEAVQEAVRRHKLLGESIVVWRDGKVVIVPPEEIELPDETNGTSKS
jgi:hypothetical protein